jgi:hypothetical protein
MLRKFYRTAIFDNIGCGSEEQNQKFVLLFSYLALSFDKIGCGSEEQNQINLFCSSLTLHYLCP